MLKWKSIAEQEPPTDWPMLVKGKDDMGFDVYAVLQWPKPSQDGYGYFSPACYDGCENAPWSKEIEITPTHWCAMDDIDKALSEAAGHVAL
jgi:hypothetical protein